MSKKDHSKSEKKRSFLTWKIFLMILFISGTFLTLMWTNQFGSYFDRELLLSKRDKVQVELKRHYDNVQEEIKLDSIFKENRHPDEQKLEKMETQPSQQEKETIEQQKPSTFEIIGINTRSLITWIIGTLNGLIMIALGIKKLFSKNVS